MSVLVTGGSGLIGQAVAAEVLRNLSCQLRVSTRSGVCGISGGLEVVAIGELSKNTRWADAVREMDVVVHAAARVHVMRDTSINPLAEFRRVNVDGTLNLAHQAADAGVKRFVFISSIKVNGECSPPDTPFRPDDVPDPIDAYGISKHEAEMSLKKISQETGMEVVIVRPVLVYGPGVKANFLSMMQWLYKGIPLPFGAIHNKRSFVALDNLVDLIVTCIDHPAAANQTFLVSDGEDLSTTELLRRTAKALNRPARLIPIPQRALESGLKILGKGGLAQRLCGSLQVDISKARELLGWAPPVSVEEALKKTADDFLAGVDGK